MLEVVSPYTGEVISEIQTQSQAELQTMLAQVYALHRDRTRWMDVQTRMDILSKASQLLKARSAEFAELIAKEGAKPLQDARVEAKRAAEGLQMCADHIRADVGRTIALGISPLTQGHHARTFFAGLRHSSLGVGGIPCTIDDMRIDKMIVTKTT